MTFGRYTKLLRLASPKKRRYHLAFYYDEWKIRRRTARKRLVQSRVVTFEQNASSLDTWVMCVHGQWVGSWHDKSTKKLIVNSVFDTLIAMEWKEKYTWSTDWSMA